MGTITAIPNFKSDFDVMNRWTVNIHGNLMGMNENW